MKTIIINCTNCQKQFEKNKGEYNSRLRRGYNNFFCSKTCSLLHVHALVTEQGKLLKSENELRYYSSPKQCPRCHKVIVYEFRENTYCSHECAAIFTQQVNKRNHSEEVRKRISNSVKQFYNDNPDIVRKYNKRSIRNEHLKKRVVKTCKNCKESFEVLNCEREKRVCCSWKCYQTLVQSGYLKGKSGGYRERGGRGNQGWYKGYYCHSTWELAWVIYNLDHGIVFKRNTVGFDYTLNGKAHKFYPDFILENNNYVEIKGWDNGTVKAKLTQFPHSLTVLTKKEITPYLQYAKEKYGADLKSLYEKELTT